MNSWGTLRGGNFPSVTAGALMGRIALMSMRAFAAPFSSRETMSDPDWSRFARTLRIASRKPNVRDGLVMWRGFQ